MLTLIFIFSSGSESVSIVRIRAEVLTNIKGRYRQTCHRTYSLSHVWFRGDIPSHVIVTFTACFDGMGEHNILLLERLVHLFILSFFILFSVNAFGQLGQLPTALLIYPKLQSRNTCVKVLVYLGIKLLRPPSLHKLLDTPARTVCNTCVHSSN